MIEIDSVRKTFIQGGREVAALAGVTLRIDAGEFVAIMGPSGSGKSTLLHLAGGLDLPSSGEVRLFGTSTRALADDQLTLLRRRRIGVVFQFFNLLPTLTTVENVALPLLLDGKSRSEALTRADAVLARAGLTARRGHLPDELSGGEMQRAAVARALVIDPELLLADEPTGNLDTQSGLAVLELLREVASDPGRTVIMVTHAPAAAAFGRRLIRLRDGRLDDSAA